MQESILSSSGWSLQAFSRSTAWKRLALLLVGLSFPAASQLASSREPVKISMSADRWTTVTGTVHFVEHMGKSSIEWQQATMQSTFRRAWRCSSLPYSIVDSAIDQLRVETSSSRERRITTCSMASLFRPARLEPVSGHDFNRALIQSKKLVGGRKPPAKVFRSETLLRFDQSEDRLPVVLDRRTHRQ